MTKKTKRFGMHRNLLMDVIKRQSGSLAKSVLEGVMNSVDAGATWCDVCLDSEVVMVEDDGGGFPDEEMIDKCFNTFGQPHDESEAKVYGNFRMGRGQMFAFGHNIWESGEFLFDVNIKEKGDDWDFHSGQEHVDGCRITMHLYDKMSPSDLAALERDLRLLVKWVNIPVTLNDEVISNDPSLAVWDYESDNCYVKLKLTGGLSVYNLGVFVKEFGGHRYGRGGEVVSKQQLRLNFARNDVMVNECPVWKEVKKFVEAQAGREIQRKASLNDTERDRIAEQMRTSEIPPAEYKGKKIFTDVLGRHHSLLQLAQAANNYPCYTNAPKGSLRGDKLHQQKLAFVLADLTMDRFDKKTASELMGLVAKLHPYAYGSEDLRNWNFVPFDKCAEEIGTKFDLVDPADYTEQEAIIVDMCNWGDFPLTRALGQAMNTEIKQRKIRIGVGESVDGWTDGENYIVIERDFAKKLHLGSVASYVRLGELILHEYCHNDADTETHTHGVEFYQAYHDASRTIGGVAQFAENTLRNLPQALTRLGKKMTKKMLSGQDKLYKLDQGVEKLPAAARRN